MPGSCIQGKEETKLFIDGLSDVETIVDVGAGAATYPKLLGDKYKYIAIEIWAPYVQMWDLAKYYDEIRIGDVRYIDLPDGDCVILGDVVEHLAKEDALRVLDKCISKYRHVVLSIPLADESGADVGGKIHYSNPFEAHLSHWTLKELQKVTHGWPLSFVAGKNNIGIFAK